MFKVCIDTGGTFTDCVVLDDQGRKSEFKSPSTPPDFSIGVVNSLKEAAIGFGMTDQEFLDQTELIIHGTTAATNALVTKNVAKTALICTKGFRDVIEIRRSLKIETHSMYEAFIPPYQPIVPRYLRLCVDERTRKTGEKVKGIDEAEVLTIVDKLKAEKVEAVAICLINSYANAENEKTVAKILEKRLDGVFITTSSEILPKIGEYERTSTCMINACLGPIVRTYLQRLEHTLKESGFKGTLLVMQANQYAQSVSAVIRKPAYLMGSGPASAPTGAAYLGKYLGDDHIITADMGGTTLDSGLLSDGVVSLKSGMWLDDDRLGIKVVEVSSIGAGGGSIAWYDSLGLLRVGPQSAGADPGPVCYGKGGTQPTVTDAAVIMGYIPEDYFWGGKLKLDKEGARKAMQPLADQLHMSIEQGAAAVFTTVSSNMSDGVTEITTRRGYDIRDFSLLACGGGGPLCGAFMGELLNCKSVIIPEFAASFCAWSMFCLDVGRDYMRTHINLLDKVDTTAMNKLYHDMLDEAMEEFKVLKVTRDQVNIAMSVDARYLGQFHEIELKLPEGEVTPQALAALKKDFHKKHEELFAFSLPLAAIEIRTLRMIAAVKSKPIDLPKLARPAAGHAAIKKHRQCFFKGRWMDTPIYDGLKVGAGDVIKGNAIVETPTFTIVIPPGFTGVVDQYGTFILKRKAWLA